MEAEGMKVKEVRVNNYKSMCFEEGGCVLKLDDKVTFLIGANESGKTNLLEAMLKFSAGGFTEDDIPYKSMWCGNPNPPEDLEMVSVKYEISEDDTDLVIKFPVLESVKEIELVRCYSGQIKIMHPQIDTEKDLNEYLTQIEQHAFGYNRDFRRFIRKYKRTHRPHEHYTRSMLLRLGVFVGRVGELTDSSNKAQVKMTLKKGRNLRKAIEALQDASAPIDEQFFLRLNEIQQLIDELPNVISGTQIADKIWDFVPGFAFVPADPNLWLVGEYLVDDIIGKSKEDEKLMSVGRLLSLAELDLSRTKALTDVMQSRVLETAGRKVTDIIRSVWLQERDIEIALKWSSIEGNKKLLVMIESPGHLGYPQQRSLGFRWLLEFYLSYAHAQRGNMVMLFEEPGVHLNPVAQDSLKEVIRDKVAQHNQVVYTTHLPGMYDLAFPEGCRAVIKEEGTTKIEDSYSPGHQYATWEIAMRAIGIDAPMLRMFRRNIITEGPADWIYLLAFAQLFAAEEPKVREIANGLIHVFPANKASKVPTLVPFFFQPGVKSVVLLDSDQAGIQAQDKLTKQYQIPNEYIKRIVMVNDVVRGEDKELGKGEHELEDLLGKRYYLSLVNKWLGVDKIANKDIDSPNIITSKIANIVKERYDRKFRTDEVAWILYDEVKDNKAKVPRDVRNRFRELLVKLVESF